MKKLVFRSLLRALVAGTLISGAGTPALAQADNASRFYEDALVRYEKNDVAGAVIQLKNALQQDPKLLPAYVLLGKAHLKQGEPGPAEVAFNQAVQLGVDRTVVAVPLAQAWFDQGKYQHLLENATGEGLNPSQRLEILLLRAAAQAELREFADAAQTLDQARRIDPTSGPVATAHAMLMLHSGNLPAAVKSADEAVRLATTDPQAWFTKGSVAHATGNVQAALAAYSEALTIAPEHLDARVARAGLLLDLGRLDEAGQDLAMLREGHPLEPRSNYLNAVLAGMRGKPEEAKKYLTDVVKFVDGIPPETLARKPQFLLLGGLAHQALGNPEKAKAHLEGYIKKNPRHPGTRKVLASILLAEGDATTALSVLEPAEKIAPNDPQLLTLMAAIQTAKGRHHKAAEYLERALTASGGSLALETSLGFSLMGAGRTDLGMEHLQRVYKKDSGQLQAGYALAILYMKQRQPKKAIEIAEQMARRAPNDPTVQNLLATAREAAGDRKGARAAYEKTVSLDKDFLPARLNLGKLDLADGKAQAARERFQGILKEQPKNVQAMFELATVEEVTGNRAQAIEWLEKIRALDRNDARAGTRLVNLYLRDGKPDRALALAKELDGLAPDNLEVLAALGNANVAAGLPRSARTAFDRMTVLAEYDPAQQVRIARLQLSAGNVAGATYSLEKALSAKADYLPALIMLTEVELARGEIAKAEQRAKNIANAHPRMAIGQRLLGDVAMAKKQFSDAINAYKAALSKDPTSQELAARLFQAFAVSGNVAKGIEFLAGWARANPRQAVGQRMLAEAYLRAGNFKAARTTLERAVNQQGEDPALLNNLAYAMNKLGDPGALAVAEKAYKLNPGEPNVIDTYGWILVQQGQIDSGLRHLREARLRNPQSGEIRYHLAVALAKSGRRDEARLELAEALKPGVALENPEEARTLMQRLSGS
jgi:putative PEP-CTERM system TPR-repeat lipoprotein